MGLKNGDRKNGKVDTGKRKFFRNVGLGVGAVALSSCVRKPKVEEYLPYFVTPEDIIPGEWYWYNTTCTECPASCSLSVKVVDGYPRKIEGNVANPLNEGKTCARGQAIVQKLYHPDRYKGAFSRKNGKLVSISWDEAVKELSERLKKADPSRVFLITYSLSGATARFWDRWREVWGIPPENHIFWETFSFEPLRKASEILFGISKIPTFRFDKADAIVSFGADFLDTWLSTVWFSRSYSKSHSVDERKLDKAYHIQVEPRMTLTGMNADEWIPSEPGTEHLIALALLKISVEEGKIRNTQDIEKVKKFLEDVDVGPKYEKIAKHILEKIEKRENLLFVCWSPSLSHEGDLTLAVATLLLNWVFGAFGRTVFFNPAFSYRVSSARDIQRFLEKAKAGEVEVLITQVDIAYSVPQSFGIEKALERIPFVVLTNPQQNNTEKFAHLILPDLETLEKWGDREPVEGIRTIIQPTVKPLYHDKQTEDVLLKLAKEKGAFAEFERFANWLENEYKNEFQLDEKGWVDVLAKGGIFSELTWEAGVGGLADFDFKPRTSKAKTEGDGYHLVIWAPYHLYDGRTANTPWICEFFEPTTKLSWITAIEMNEKTALELGVRYGDIVEVSSPYGKVELPVLIYDGVADGVVSIPLGRGHEKFGRYASGKGVNPAQLIPAKITDGGEIAWTSVKVKIRKTGRRKKRLPENEGVPRRLSRDVAPFTTLSLLPKIDKKKREEEYRKLIEAKFPKGDWTKYGRDSGRESPYKWEMTIDLDRCIGCGACEIACRAENNLPVVGQEEVERGREITWIRVERYWVDEGKAVFVPMMCQHCDSAPCEYVCPVYATMHSSDGLNIQVYNRCVGTRFCANNCPYKVRYFNWFDYKWDEPLNFQLNPDVTVRSKGVMEKCSFCVQRIRYAHDKAKDEGRLIRDGEVVPACAQVCPTDAIIFGNAKDKKSKVVLAREMTRRGDRILKELGTEPAVVYLEKVFHELEIKEGDHH